MAKKKDVPLTAPVASNDDWKGEDDYRTLQRAHEIQNDPERMKHVDKHHKKAKRAISSIDELTTRIKSRQKELADEKESKVYDMKEEGTDKMKV